MSQTVKVGESPDAKSKRMAVEVPARIAETAEASRAIYDVIKPADEQPRRKAAAARRKAASEA